MGQLRILSSTFSLSTLLVHFSRSLSLGLFTPTHFIPPLQRARPHLNLTWDRFADHVYYSTRTIQYL